MIVAQFCGIVMSNVRGIDVLTGTGIIVVALLDVASNPKRSESARPNFRIALVSIAILLGIAIALSGLL